MRFPKKLDLLMKTLVITNNRLAKALSVDTSLISRWRSGTRFPAKENDYIERITDFVIHAAKTKSQKTAILELLHLEDSGLFCNEHQLYAELYAWLSDSVKEYEDDFSEELIHQQEKENLFQGEKVEVDVYWGTEGKRKAILRFLSELAKLNKKCSIYLMFDEFSHWNTDKDFFKTKWYALLQKLIEIGCRIYIVYPANWNSDELPHSIEYTLPFFLSGTIKPFYYPKFQGIIFKHALFIAPKEIAISSDGLISDGENAVYFYYYNKKIIQTLSNKIKAYLQYCKPLFKTITTNDIKEFYLFLSQFLITKGDVYARTPSPNYVTAPPAVIQSLLDRHLEDNNAKQSFLKTYENRTKDFIKFLEQNSFILLLSIPSIEEILQGHFQINFYYLNDTNFSYTPAEYIAHCKHLIYLINRYENFKLYIDTSNTLKANILIKPDIGAVISTNVSPKSFRVFDNANITYAIVKHLENTIFEIPDYKKSKEYTIRQLTELIEQLQNI